MPRKLTYFGPKGGKRPPYIPDFGVLLMRNGQVGACYVYKKKVAGITTESTEELWGEITSPTSPSLWYSYNLNDLFYNLLLQILPPDKIVEKVLTSKAKEVEKIVIIPRGETDTLKLVIRQEKRRKRAKTLGDITILNAANYYDFGLVEAARDFKSPYGSSTISELLLSFLYVMTFIHNWAVHTLRVKLQTTLSATAMRALQVHYIEDVIPKLPKPLEDFISPAFTGARTELYQMYQVDAKQYDKNGLYGEACTLSIPLKVPYIREGITPSELMNCKDLGFADVDVYVPEWLDRGPLPVRDEGRGLVYPVGHIKSTEERPIRYFTPLLEEAVKNYGVVIEKVNFTVLFKTSKQILKGWADFTADLKVNSSNMGEKKLNTLAQQVIYGKFAQKETRQTVHIGAVPKERRRDKNITFPSDDIPMWFESTERKLANRLPHIAAAVSGWAHVIMLRDYARVEKFGVTVCYTDTDSLVTDKYIPKDMTGATGLGKYRLEDDHFDFIGLAPKWYYRRKKGKLVAKVKGIPDYEPMVSDIEKLFKGEKLKFQWDKSPTVLESIVMRFNYEAHPELFQDVIDNFHTPEKRTLPGTGRGALSPLDFDVKRKQLSLVSSRPLDMEEV